jgi:hypothetical protein
MQALPKASTVVGAALPEAATEVAAEATIAESTRSIQLSPAKSKRARWANAAVGPVSPYLSSSSPFVAVISAAPRSYMSSTEFITKMRQLSHPKNRGNPRIPTPSGMWITSRVEDFSVGGAFIASHEAMVAGSRLESAFFVARG